MKHVTSFITKIDFLGDNLSFEISKNTKFKTFLGGTFSIVLYAVYIYFFYVFSKDFFQNANPNSYLDTKFH